MTVSDHGHSCEEHEACASILTTGIVMRLYKVQVVVDGKEETAIVVYHVTDSIDRCCMGFLPRPMTRLDNAYHGLLTQIMDILLSRVQVQLSLNNIISQLGCTKAAIISATEF